MESVVVTLRAKGQGMGPGKSKELTAQRGRGYQDGRVEVEGGGGPH